MIQFLISIFGPNWRTTVFGLIQLLLGTAINYYNSLEPGAVFDWKFFGGQALLAIALFFTKDSKVTGGSVPSTEEAASRVEEKK